MVQFKICLIAAIGQHRELGKDNKLLIKIPEDMLHFKNVTMEDKISLLQDIEFLKSMTEDDIENK